MTTWTLQVGAQQSRAFSPTSSFGLNPATPRTDANISGFKRHNADYGTGTDLAPGGAD